MECHVKETLIFCATVVLLRLTQPFFDYLCDMSALILLYQQLNSPLPFTFPLMLCVAERRLRLNKLINHISRKLYSNSMEGSISAVERRRSDGLNTVKCERRSSRHRITIATRYFLLLIFS